MKTQTSKTAIFGKALLLIPLFAGLVYSCSSEAIVEKDPTAAISAQKENILELDVDQDGSIFLNNKEISFSELQDIDKGKYASISISASTEAPQAIIEELVEVMRSKGARTISICSPGNRDFMNSIPTSNDKEKDTPEMVAEYNELVKNYNSLPEGKREVKQEDANRIMSILSRMTLEQREKAEKINFDVPPPPPPAPAPVPEMNAENVPPPPPPAPSYEDLVEKGATFYYKGEIITPEEALKLVRVEKKVNVQIIDIDENPVVKLTDKEQKN